MRTVLSVLGPTSLPTARRKASQLDKRNRPALMFACAPLLALAAFGVVSTVQKQLDVRTSSVRWGQLNRQEARATARQRLAPVLGVPADTLTSGDTFAQAGSLLRKDDLMTASQAHSWHVLVHSGDAQYLVRLNADTGQMYGFNRLDSDVYASEEEEAPVAVATPEPDVETGGLLSRSEGEIRARQCLRRLGLQPDKLTQFKAQASPSSPLDPSLPQWNFSYHRPVPGWGSRTIIVCINRETGAPDTFWNPTGAFTAF